MGKKRYRDRVEIGMQYANKYNLVKINEGDTVLINPKAKLEMFVESSRNKVRGKIGKVVRKGKYVYTVNIDGINWHFQRMDLKKVE